VKAHLHANASVHLYGGKPEDYQDIHDFIDSSKAHIADIRHRAIFHHSFGCFIVERVFGTTRVNSDGKVYSPRDVAEEHILQDLGRIPSVQDYLGNMRAQPWMSAPKSKHLSIRKGRK
jgi:hypothetical protein